MFLSWNSPNSWVNPERISGVFISQGAEVGTKKKKKATKKKEKKKTPNQNIPQKIQTTNKKKQTTTIPVDPKVHFFAIWLNQKAVFPAAVLKVKVLQVEASWILLMMSKAEEWLAYCWLTWLYANII